MPCHEKIQGDNRIFFWHKVKKKVKMSGKNLNHKKAAEKTISKETKLSPCIIEPNFLTNKTAKNNVITHKPKTGKLE